MVGGLVEYVTTFEYQLTGTRSRLESRLLPLEAVSRIRNLNPSVPVTFIYQFQCIMSLPRPLTISHMMSFCLPSLYF